MTTIIKPKKERARGTIKDIYCGACGHKVPFSKKYLLSFGQSKMKDVQKWIVHLSYICPECAVPTVIPYQIYHKDKSYLMKKINLYK